MTRFRAITFDVTHTLIHAPRVAEIYADVLTRHGLETTGERVTRYLPVVWQEMACRTEIGKDRFLSHPEGPKGWWSDFLRRLAEYLELPEPSPFAAAELYHRFSQAESWEVFPDVRPALARLQGMGIALGVISNWDDRLGRLLTHLELTRYFDAVVFSAAIGIEKPDPRIFRYALDLLGVPPEQALHVGDGVREDVEGALAAGMQALHLVRPGRVTSARSAADRRSASGDLEDLVHLADRLATA